MEYFELYIFYSQPEVAGILNRKFRKVSPVVHVIDAHLRAISNGRPSYYGCVVQTWVAKCKPPLLLAKRVIRDILRQFEKEYRNTMGILQTLP